MQTFLPYKSFTRSAKCLDRKRLCKQRLEAYQILCCLLEGKKGWANHPVVLMWKGCEGALWEYDSLICSEWIRRGYANTKMEINLARIYKRFWSKLYKNRHNSDWVGKKVFHDSHKSNLLRKDKRYYSRFKWNVSSTLPYIWPTVSKTITLAQQKL